MKKYLLLAATALALAGCNDADVASRNLSTAADNFQISRRIIFYNGFTNDYMLSIEGLCSLGKGESSRAITVTCKVAADQFKKHILGLSDNVTYFVEQLDAAPANVYHYKVVLKPSVILPSFEVR